MLTLYQWLQACVILLHRPFHLYWREYNWSPAQRLAPEHTPVRACIVAAQEASAVLAQYVDDLDRLPCDFIFPIVLAAGTLWQHRGEYSAGPDRAKVQEQIDLCVKCLAIMGKSWKSAGDSRQELIRGEYELISVFGQAVSNQDVTHRFCWCSCDASTDNTRYALQPTYQSLQRTTTNAQCSVFWHDDWCDHRDTAGDRRERSLSRSGFPDTSTYRSHISVPRHTCSKT